jgi:8-oxo-dGTP diphosphatase
MEKITTLTDQDVGLRTKKEFVQKRERHAARAIVFKAGKVALLHARRDRYYKLPGGGVEDGEDILETLEREILEEVGAQIEVTDEVGIIIEKRAKNGLLQTSHCYIGEKVGKLRKPKFTKSELAEGFEIVWANNIDDAIALVESAHPRSSGGKFMRTRDALLLRAARELILVK